MSAWLKWNGTLATAIKQNTIYTEISVHVVLELACTSS